MSAQPIDFSVTPDINLLPVFENSNLRFGKESTSASSTGFALNGSVGSLYAPQFSTDGGTTWQDASFDYINLAVAIGVGGTGWDGGTRLSSLGRAKHSLDRNNIPGRVVYGETNNLYAAKNSLLPFTYDTSGVTNNGTGRVIWTGYFDINDSGTPVTLEIKREYALDPGATFIKETTTIKNVDSQSDVAHNLRWWTGIADDFIGPHGLNPPDFTDKLRGNISNGAFTPISSVDTATDQYLNDNRSLQSNAVMIGSAIPGVGSRRDQTNNTPVQLFYTSSSLGTSVISNQNGWSFTSTNCVVPPGCSADKWV